MKDLNWYAVYTRPRWEKKVTELLTKKDIVAYCPFNKLKRQWSEGRRSLYEPLFSSYVFVQLSDDDHVKVLQTTGVINFVYWLSVPVVIGNEEINAVKHFVNEYTDVVLEKSPINFRDKVKVIKGPLMKRKGNVLEVRNHSVKVILPSLGRTLVAETCKENVESFSYIDEYSA